MSYESQSITFPADVFSLAVHPSRPLLSTGLSSGHVYSYTWNTGATESEKPIFSLAWKTHRHKGSCRCAAYSINGDVLYTTGTDPYLKIADSETGQVISKAVTNKSTDSATALLPLSPEHLLVGTDLGDIHLYDIRDSATFTSTRPSLSWNRAHDDYISSLHPLPSSESSITGFSRQFVATGDTTLSHLDARKSPNVLAKSEDQEDEMLCSTYVANAPSRQTGGSEKILTGTSAGVVTTWTKGFWEDHQDRIPIARGTGDSVEALLTLPGDFDIPGQSEWGAYFAAGSGDGKIRIVKLGQSKILSTFSHSYSADEAKHMAGGKIRKGDQEQELEEGVTALALNCEGKIVSAGGTVVKIWSLENIEAKTEDGQVVSGRQEYDSDEENSSNESSEEEKEKLKRRKKKRKGGKGKAKSIGVKNVHGFHDLD
ncbi:WD40-repeat-containing domain protein [Geopyxis carbonaria]|nr:WD40-repeat-containing domain protein [Geopyxis carbonaria]